MGKVCGGAPPAPTPPPTGVFTVSGAAGGSDDSTATRLNGEYFQDGMHNGRGQYIQGWDATDAVFRWEVKGDWAADNLGTPGKSKWTAAVNDNHRYFSETDSQTPPQDAWTARTDFATGTISLDYPKDYELEDCGNCPDGSFTDDVAVTHSSWQWNNGLSGYNNPQVVARARKAVASMGYKFFLKQVSL